jgi:hypothetical protein
MTLVKELREWTRQESICQCVELTQRAADRIASLEAELARSRQANVYDGNAHRRVAQLEAALRKVIAAGDTDDSAKKMYWAAREVMPPESTSETACEHENVSPGGGYNAWCDKCGGMLPASALNRGGKP